MDFMLKHEGIIRLAAFISIFVAMALAERLIPRRKMKLPRAGRWFSNVIMAFLNTFVLRIVFSVAAFGMASIAQQKNWGLLNTIELAFILKILVAFMVMDFAIYLQHVLFHAVPNLWRLHMVHHTDMDFDVTTGIRFHPFEIVISMGIKIGVVAALGPPPIAVLIFEVVLNGTSMFNHSNLYIPEKVDKYVRLLVVTPDMHRVHHSIHMDETNSNYGFNLPWWDRILATYRAQPREGHQNMEIGVSEYRNAEKLFLHRLLILPFFKQKN